MGSCQLRVEPMQEHSFQGRYGAFELVWKDLTKASRTFFFLLSCSIANDTLISGSAFCDGPLGGYKEGGSRVSGFSLRATAAARSQIWWTFCLQSWDPAEWKGNADRGLVA